MEFAFDELESPVLLSKLKSIMALGFMASQSSSRSTKSSAMRVKFLGREDKDEPTCLNTTQLYRNLVSKWNLHYQ